MKLHLIQYLNDVNKLSLISKDSIVYFSDSIELIKYDLINLKKDWKLIIDTQSLLLADDKYLYPYKQYSSIYKIEIGTGKVNGMIRGNIFPIEISNDKIICEYDEDGIYYLAEIDILTFEVEKKYHIDQKRIVANTVEFLVLTTTNEILVINHAKHLFLWSHLFAEFLSGIEVTQYGEIIVFSNRIFVYLADNKNSKNVATIAIDIHSGKAVKTYQGFAGNLLLQNDRLYVANDQTVKMLDLLTDQISEFDFTDVLKPKGLKIHWNSFKVQDNLLYFVDGHWATTNKLGILNLQSKELVWHTELVIEDGINNNIQEIKVNGNRLYVHCSDKTLHIFEN